MVEVKVNGYGWAAFIKNDWTAFAEDHGLELSFQPIRPRGRKAPRGVSLGGKKIADPSCYVPSDWADWAEGRFLPSSTSLTIYEHKSSFKGVRPDWAKSFAERNILRHEISRAYYRESSPVPLADQSTTYWYLERELFLPNQPNKEAAVERVLDAGGRCVRVTLVHLGPDLIRQEDKTGRGRWSVTFSQKDIGELKGSSYEQLLYKPNLWSKYLADSVAQCH